jgi:hypothetical protein
LEYSMINPRTTPTDAAGRAAAQAIAQAAAQARETERAKAVAALRAAHPDLSAPTDQRDGLVTAARNLRAQLKARWPGIKFCVRTERFAGGDSLRVSWTDGPNSTLVDAIACRYRAGSFDGMTDCYDYCRTVWTDAFGDAKYVTTTRDYSPAAIAWAKATYGDTPDPHYRREAYWIALGGISIKRLKTQAK